MDQTRDRIVREAMRLFAEHGYAGTSVAKIETASGLSGGSGGLYKHFASKRDVLVEGVTRLLQAGGELHTLLDSPPLRDESPGTSPAAVFRQIAKAGLDRLEQERDFNRVLLRDLAQFPDLLAQARDDEIARNHRRLTAWLQSRAGASGVDHPDRDWSAFAAVLIGATSHYWLLRDIFGGTHPTGVSEEAYLAALSELAAHLFEI